MSGIRASVRLHDPRWPVAAGDVVIHRFPTREGAPGKRRPCLVIAVRPRPGRAPRLTRAYGADAERRANRGVEISVRRAPDMTAAGLRAPTRFVGARRLRPGRGLGADAASFLLMFPKGSALFDQTAPDAWTAALRVGRCRDLRASPRRPARRAGAA
jgi:hypothetical protein